MIRFAVVRAEDDEALRQGEPPRGLLGPRELEVLARLEFPARRRKWLLGRAAAKRLLCPILGEVRGTAPPAPETIEISNEPSGAPYAEEQGQGRLPFPISISHRAEVGLCAVSLEPSYVVGADLELVEPRDEALVRQFFDAHEAEEVGRASGRARDFLVARTWSAKEAVLKVLGLGLRLDTRLVEVREASSSPAGPPFPEGFLGLSVTMRGERVPCAFRDDGAWVLVLAARHATVP